MNHPKGLTVDDRGNIYIANTDNMAIRKISDTGITTIAGSKKSRRGGHVDRPSEDAKFSNDFHAVYIGSSCSFLVRNRGNLVIHEIQLHFDDCAYQYGSGFPLGIPVLVAAGFFGYMLALLLRRLDESLLKPSSSPYQKQLNSIPTEGEEEKQDESFFGSLGRLIAQTGASALEILGGLFPWIQRKQWNHHSQHKNGTTNNRIIQTLSLVQDSYAIPNEDESPSIKARTPTPRKAYAFMSEDSEKMQQLRKSRAIYSGWEVNFQQQTQKQQLRHQHYTSTPHTYYEQSSEKTNKIVFGAAQQDGQREPMMIKPLDPANPIYGRRSSRSRSNSMGYSQGN